MPNTAPAGVVVRHPHGIAPRGAAVVLTLDALAFIAALERRFRDRRRELLAQRRERQRALDAGAMPGLLVETRPIRDGEWQVAPTPPALERRRVEITGPVDRKMMINALNSGADAFMADFEDALSPTWANVVDGQANVQDAVRGTLAFTGPDGRRYALDPKPATLMLRPRGWHLDEAHVLVDDAPTSASLFDFGLAVFHNAAEQLSRGVGPYFYLPKLEGHREARLWNDVFVAAQEALGIPLGSVRATVLIETILGAFEMEEMLYELRDHAAGLNAGRWDYIFSIIKKFSGRADMVLPDRAQVTMTVPFMRAYTERLVRVCHRRGAHAIGGMAAFVPNRRDRAVTEAAIAKVRADKLREAEDGFDGTWVAHPDLVPIAMDVFVDRLGDRPNQKDLRLDDLRPDAGALTRLDVPNGRVTDEGMRANVDVALRYIDAWLRGQGAVAIHNLMEDAATAEIARAQLWQWVRHGTRTDDGERMTAERYRAARTSAVDAIRAELGAAPTRLDDAATLLDALVLAPEFVDFLTLPAYPLLDDDDSVAPTPVIAEAAAKPADDEHVPRGSVRVACTIAERGATRLRELLQGGALRALETESPEHAVRLVAGGATALCVSRRAGADAVDERVRRIALALLDADRADVVANGAPSREWLVPIVAELTPDDDAVRACTNAIACILAGAAALRVVGESAAATTTRGAARAAAAMLDVPVVAFDGHSRVMCEGAPHAAAAASPRDAYDAAVRALVERYGRTTIDA